jgi:hypothetical protein
MSPLSGSTLVTIVGNRLLFAASETGIAANPICQPATNTGSLDRHMNSYKVSVGDIGSGRPGISSKMLTGTVQSFCLAFSASGRAAVRSPQAGRVESCGGEPFVRVFDVPAIHQKLANADKSPDAIAHLDRTVERSPSSAIGTAIMSRVQRSLLDKMAQPALPN